MHGILGQVWTGQSIAMRFYSSTKPGVVTETIGLFDDINKKETLRRCSDHGMFPFTYDGENDSNPGPGEDPINFVEGRLVAVEFQVYSRNYRTAKMPMGSFGYAFYLSSVYLVSRPAASVSTPRKRLKHMKEMEGIEQPPRMRHSHFGESPLEYGMKQRALEEAMADDEVEL